MEDSLTRDRILKWQSKCSVTAQNSEGQFLRKRVKLIFDMKTLLEVETHDQLWQVMEKRPGWIRQEKEGGQIEYLLISSQRKCWAKASLPSDLESASPDALQNFVNIVNKFEHADVFALWETFKVCPVPVPCEEKSSVESHQDESESLSTSKKVHDVRLASGSVYSRTRRVYNG